MFLVLLSDSHLFKIYIQYTYCIFYFIPLCNRCFKVLVKHHYSSMLNIFVHFDSIVYILLCLYFARLDN